MVRVPLFIPCMHAGEHAWEPGGVMCKMLSVKQRGIREAVVTLPIIYRVYTMILNAHSFAFPATLF